MNDASLKLYIALAPQIKEMISKEEEEKAKLSEETKRLADEVKEAFGKVLPPNKSPKTLESTSSGLSTHSADEGKTLLELIEINLCLPEKWLKEQENLYKSPMLEAYLPWKVCVFENKNAENCSTSLVNYGTYLAFPKYILYIFFQ